MALRARDWTPAVQATFLEALADGGNVRKAARRIRRSPTTCYARRKRDAAFAEAWDGAMAVAMETVLEPEAIRRAVDGVAKPVYHEGQVVGTVKAYSDTLLIFLLKGWKPEKYKDRRDVFHRGTVALWHKLEQVSAMSPEELQAFLAEVEAYLHQREAGGAGF